MYVFRAGDGPGICDTCGFKWNLSRLRKQWNGIMACPDDFDPRHPQELVRGKADRQAVPNARPEPTPVFVVTYQRDANGTLLFNAAGFPIPV